MTRAKRIAVVVGDIGSALELVPAVAELERRGSTCKWFADPEGRAGMNVLEKKGIPYESRPPNGDDTFSLVLVGASVTAYQYQIKWTHWGQNRGAGVMWYEDLHTTAARPAVLIVDPHVMLVIDEVAADITRRTRPRMDLAVRVVGKPTFDDLPAMTIDAPMIRERVRSELKIGSEDFLVVYWSAGDAPDQTREHLVALRQLVMINGRRIVLAPRIHPKLSAVASELWDLATTSFCFTVDARQIKPAEHLSLAADLVVCAWSGTEGLRAALLGQIVVIPLFPNDTERRIAAGHSNGMTPLLRAGAALRIDDPVDLVECVASVITDGDEIGAELGANSQRSFAGLFQPGAAVRIADIVMAELV